MASFSVVQLTKAANGATKQKGGLNADEINKYLKSQGVVIASNLNTADAREKLKDFLNQPQRREENTPSKAFAKPQHCYTQKHSRVELLGLWFDNQKNTIFEGDDSAEKLYRRVTESDELLQEMNKCESISPTPGSIRMPCFYPHVCVSFRSEDLASDKKTRRGSNKKAGSEPWGICDYIRDALNWPVDFIYIDAEQVGDYDVDHYDGDKHFVGGPCKESPCEKLCEGGARNWKKTFTWAQKECKMMMYFFSNRWWDSQYCVRELVDFISFHTEEVKRCGGTPESIEKVPDLCFVYLSNEPFQLKACDRDILHTILPSTKFEKFVSNEHALPIFCGHLGEAIKNRIISLADNGSSARHAFKCQEFDLSPWFTWHGMTKGGGKVELKAAAKACSKLMEYLRERVGEGVSSVYKADRVIGKVVDDLDDRCEPRRNRYKPNQERRIRINNVTEDDIFTDAHGDGLLPGVGPKKWKAFVDAKKILKFITNIGDLQSIPGWGKGTCATVLPFISFNTGPNLTIEEDKIWGDILGLAENTKTKV